MEEQGHAAAGRPSPERAPASVGFLLSRAGYSSARRFKERLTPLDLDPGHFLLLRFVAAGEGQTQHALGERLRVAPSRMVALVDALEQRGLVERRRHPSDRRAHALHLTPGGRRLLEQALRVAADHEAELCADLDARERRQLIDLLRRLASDPGVPAGVHPGLAGQDAAAGP